jgi:hypothetical protein
MFAEMPVSNIPSQTMEHWFSDIGILYLWSWNCQTFPFSFQLHLITFKLSRLLFGHGKWVSYNCYVAFTQVVNFYVHSYDFLKVQGSVR